MQRQFVTLEENATVASAVQEMQSQKLESVIVTRDGLAFGMVTTGDVVEKVVLKGEDSSLTSLKSVMTFPLVTISSNGTVKQALQLMRLNRIKRVPVTDSTGIIGVVTQRSLADAVSKSVLERTLERAKSTFKMRYKPVLGNLGVLLQFSAVLLVVPALVGTALGQASSITGVYLEVVGLSFTGFFLMAYGEKGQMNLKQASIFIVASFVLMSLFGSLPYIYLNPFLPRIDANSLFVNSLFESASGFTTTGLSMITQPENLPQSFNFYRSYTQWVGGLSFVYLVMILFFPEEKLSAWKSVLGGGMLRFKEFIVTLVGIFSVYTVVLVLLLMLSGQIASIYAVSAVFATITGGGFSPTSDFISPGNAGFLVVTSAGMTLSALPFAFHYYIFSRKGLFTKKTLGTEVTVYLILLVASIPVFFLLAAGTTGFDIGAAVFHTISASTNSGFQYINMQSLPVAAKVFMIVLMMVGGTAFSTAGGIKIGRFVILYQEFAKRIGTKKSEMQQSQPIHEALSSISSTANPHRSEDNGILERIREEYRTRDFREIVQKHGELLQVIREVVGIKLVREILIVISLFVFVSILTGSVLSYTTGRSFEDGMFESVSALSTTGLSTGITSLALDSFSKLMLTANMILGRFEIIAVLYIFFSALRK
ncbi:MAG TPA: potassium transporter TrkG [Nitrososphaera sp.]|jgi:trk system potassium uptake protein TrkH|nr:potassium transporter TrkG [Nitrososphaera sp.]